MREPAVRPGGERGEARQVGLTTGRLRADYVSLARCGIFEKPFTLFL
jgi:hypothetical protein